MDYRLTVKDTCPRCDGSGIIPGKTLDGIFHPHCNHCGGRGVVDRGMTIEEAFTEIVDRLDDMAAKLTVIWRRN